MAHFGMDYDDDTLRGALQNLKKKYNETYAKHMALANKEVMKAHEDDVEDHYLNERMDENRDHSKTGALSLLAKKLRNYKGSPPKRTESKGNNPHSGAY